MPRGDGTGPMGMGPMTGRAAGYCAGYPTPGFMNSGGGQGLGMAWGRGGGGGRAMAWRRGRGGGFGFASSAAPRFGGPYAAPAPFAPPTRAQELDMLRSQADWLKSQMDSINQRMDELNQQKS